MTDHTQPPPQQPENGVRRNQQWSIARWAGGIFLLALALLGLFANSFLGVDPAAIVVWLVIALIALLINFRKLRSKVPLINSSERMTRFWGWMALNLIWIVAGQFIKPATSTGHLTSSLPPPGASPTPADVVLVVVIGLIGGVIYSSIRYKKTRRQMSELPGGAIPRSGAPEQLEYRPLKLMAFFGRNPNLPLQMAAILSGLSVLLFVSLITNSSLITLGAALSVGTLVGVYLFTVFTLRRDLTRGRIWLSNDQLGFHDEFGADRVCNRAEIDVIVIAKWKQSIPIEYVVAKDVQGQTLLTLPANEFKVSDLVSLAATLGFPAPAVVSYTLDEARRAFPYLVFGKKEQPAPGNG